MKEEPDFDTIVDGVLEDDDLETRISELEAELEGIQSGGGLVFWVAVAALAVSVAALWRTF